MVKLWFGVLWALLTGAFPVPATSPPAVTFALGGDLDLARNKGDLAPLGATLRADVVLANLESPLTDQPKATAGIDLRAQPSRVSALAPLTHLATENNHALDGGAAGQAQSQRVLRSAGKVPVTRQAVLSKVGGVNVALLAYWDDGRSPPPLPAILTEVRRAAKLAPIVVVMPHWGAEYGPTTTRQRTQARQLAQAGATLIVGSGPHVLQGQERIGRALVLYSLGNLLLNQPYPATWLGAVVRVQVSGTDMQACAVPTFTRGGQVRLATGTDRRRALERLGLAGCP